MTDFETVAVYVGLGSNLGNAEEHLNEALSRLETYGPDVSLAALSGTYRTEPQGDIKDQPWFTNQVAKLAVDPVIWSPEGLLSTLLAIEDQMGRVRDVPGGPRVIDLDILLFDDRAMQTGFLDLPHPRMKDRAFVLVPLREIAPDLVFPDGETIDDALARLRYEVRGDEIHQE